MEERRSKMRRRCKFWLHLILILSLIISTASVNPVTASPTATVSVNPPTIVDETKVAGTTFNISINIKDVTDLFGYDFTLKYDTSVLTATSVTIGDIFLPGYIKWHEDIDDTVGYVWYAITQSIGEVGVSDDGTLATIEFTVDTSLGETILDLCDTKLSGPPPDANPIAHEVYDGCFSNTGFCTPVANFTFTPASPIVEETVTFNASYDPVTGNGSYDPDGYIESWDWDFGDGITNSGEIVGHAYTAAGTYTVTLTVTDNQDLTNTDTTDVTVLVHDIAITGVTASHIAAMAGVPVSINVTVANEGDFEETFTVKAYANDALIQTEPDITLEAGDSEILTLTWNTTGLSEGDYTIKANATIVPEEYNTTNNELTYGTLSIKPYNDYRKPVSVGGVTFYVRIKTKSIVSNFTYRSTDKEINFNATAVPGLEGMLAWWNVTIAKVLLNGDFTVLIDGYSVAFTPTLNATHTSLYFTYTLNIIQVQIEGTIAATPPEASFTPSKTEAFVNEPITFNASASDDPDGHIVSYEWDFDDGNVTTVDCPIITHIYTLAKNKTYQIRLTVTDNHTIPLKDTYNDTTVTITALKPVANFTVSETEAYVNEVIAFTASASYDPDGGPIVTYEWDFDDGNVTVVSNPIMEHTYTSPHNKTYYVNLTVTDNDGQNGTYAKSIQITAFDPVANFTISKTEAFVGEPITFNASASYDPDGPDIRGIVHYEWNFGDETPIVTETDPITTHNYIAAGLYTVTLTVEDNDGTTHSVAEFVTIIKLSSTISITASPTSITVDENTTLTGSITPKRAGVTVTIWYRLSGEETWSTLETVTTDDNSQYSYIWTPPAATTYEVKASWEGDENTKPNESVTSTVTVNEAPTGIPLYLIAAVGAIIIIASCIAAYYLIRKKR